ncbi:methylglyoxal reductase (NADPH-dependent) gre2 [Tulasnella sp. 408]|nr:methylglyoxal reductase (NADPH-dependent) gre2 [Tulasnella sp. 408]
MNRTRTLQRLICRRTYATQPFVAQPGSAEQRWLLPLPSRPKPESPSFFTGAQAYQDTIISLETALTSARQRLKDAHVFPVPEHLKATLPANTSVFKKREEMSQAIDQTKIRPTQYKKVIKLLNELHQLRTVAQVGKQWEIEESLSELLENFERDNKAAILALRFGQTEGNALAEGEEAEMEWSRFDEHGRSYALGKRKNSAARLWLIKLMNTTTTPRAQVVIAALVNRIPHLASFASPPFDKALSPYYRHQISTGFTSIDPLASMPAINSPAAILVTGVNGYIGPHVVATLLKYGYSVRGAVRSLAKGVHIKKLFEEYGDRVQIVEVSDFNKPGAFDEAVKGVGGILHLGSPMPQKVNHIDDIMGPSVDGTIALLRSAQQYGWVCKSNRFTPAFFLTTMHASPEIKRVVLTSTSGNVMEPKEGEYTWTETDWFDTALKIVEAQGVHAPEMYIAAKIQQERAMFDFVQRNKASIKFDAVSILPPYCFGPPTNEQADIAEIQSGAVAAMYKAFNWPRDQDLPPDLTGADAMVDVRDVAELLVRSLFTEKAGGERFLAVGHRFTWQQVWDALNAEPKLLGAPVGNPGTGSQNQWNPKYSVQKSKDVFDFEYRSFQETMRDAWSQFLERGWIKRT